MGTISTSSGLGATLLPATDPWTSELKSEVSSPVSTEKSRGTAENDRAKGPLAHRLHDTSSPLNPAISQMSNHVVVVASTMSACGCRSVHGAYTKLASPPRSPMSSERL